MEYDSGERSHSSPGYSYSEPHYQLTPEEKEQQAQKKREEEQQRQLEQKVKTALISVPAQAPKLIHQEITTNKELWVSFLENLEKHFDFELAESVAINVSDGKLPFSELIADGIKIDVAVELYHSWDLIWNETVKEIASTHEHEKPTHKLTTDSHIEGKQTDNKSLHTTQTVKDSTQEHQFNIDTEPTYEVAFLPAIPVAIVGGFVLVAISGTLLLQIEDENGELVTVNEYASRPIAELLEAISNDIKNYYQTTDEVAKIKEWVAPALEKIVVTQEPENQVYTTPNREQQTVEHTGSVPPKVETQTPPFDTEAGMTRRNESIYDFEDDNSDLAPGYFEHGAEDLPNLTGKNREEAREELRNAGYVDKGFTPGGYEKWYHPDGSRVLIRPNGEVTRTGPKVEPTDGGKKYRPAYGPNGEILTTPEEIHDTGENLVD